MPKHKSDPFTGRSNEIASPRGAHKAWWDEGRTELSRELGHRKLRRVRQGREYVSGRRIA